MTSPLRGEVRMIRGKIEDLPRKERERSEIYVDDLRPTSV
jgi:hypothetical protein